MGVFSINLVRVRVKSAKVCVYFQGVMGRKGT